MIDFDSNMKLVYFVYNKKFKQYSYLKEDLYQEGFMALFKACSGFNPVLNNSFSSYAIKAIQYGMTTYILKNKNKHANTKTFSELESDGEFEFESLISCEDPYQINAKQLIDENISKLKERDKQIIQKYYIDNYTQQELAELYKINQSHISRITHKFKNTLKKVVNGE